MDSTWKSLAATRGISIDKHTNTWIIVDDILSWAHTVSKSLAHMESQPLVCRSQNLSLTSKKTNVFPKKLEFVGINVSQDGNRPVMSKHQLVQCWPDPVVVCDISSFIRFAIFYSSFILFFETWVSRLRESMRLEPTITVEPRFDKNART